MSHLWDARLKLAHKGDSITLKIIYREYKSTCRFWLSLSKSVYIDRSSGRGVVGGGGWVGGGEVTSYIWHSTDVRAEWSPCFSAARYMISPLFSTKSIWLPIFLDSYVKGPSFLTSRYTRIFFDVKFLEPACSLGIQWIDCDICLTTSNKWIKKNQRAKYE